MRLEFQHTDILEFESMQYYDGKYPCEKPLAMIQHLIETSSRPGDKVLDPVAGSPTSAVACHQLDRAFTGSEFGQDEYHQVVELIKAL